MNAEEARARTQKAREAKDGKAGRLWHEIVLPQIERAADNGALSLLMDKFGTGTYADE